MGLVRNITSRYTVSLVPQDDGEYVLYSEVQKDIDNLWTIIEKLQEENSELRNRLAKGAL